MTYAHVSSLKKNIRFEGNVGITIINHPPNHLLYRWYQTLKNGWFIIFIIVIPTLQQFFLKLLRRNVYAQPEPAPAPKCPKGSTYIATSVTKNSLEVLPSASSPWWVIKSQVPLSNGQMVNDAHLYLFGHTIHRILYGGFHKWGTPKSMVYN